MYDFERQIDSPKTIETIRPTHNVLHMLNVYTISFQGWYLWCVFNSVSHSVYCLPRTRFSLNITNSLVFFFVSLWSRLGHSSQNMRVRSHLIRSIRSICHSRFSSLSFYVWFYLNGKFFFSCPLLFKITNHMHTHTIALIEYVPNSESLIVYSYCCIQITQSQ